MHHEQPEQIERIVFCSGKVFYDIDKHRKDKGITNAAVIRVEQLYPFHDEMVKALVSQFPNAAKFVWCQEEPKNMGAYTFVAPRLSEALDSHIRYSGRKSSASPATGSKAMHKKEQNALLEGAFNC